MKRRVGLCVAALVAIVCGPAQSAPADERAAAKAALLKAVRFFHREVARHGGYVYAYSGDLRLREGEGVAGEDVIWVQPPGTPAVGEAFLDAYEATGDAGCLGAARDAAHAMARGQLHSGGWHYQIDFSAAKRREAAFRFDPEWKALPDPAARERPASSGWEEWKRRKFKGNLTVLDDDTTQAATRFLVRFDQVTRFADERVHRAAAHALSSLVRAQYPNGAWSASYDRFPVEPPSSETYPVKNAQYPADWPRTWPKDFTGCYVTNDNLIADAIDTMLLAAEVYGEEIYRASARRAGDFLVRAQMPAPQPAWAQQYDKGMTPVWSRAFEPTAISGGESQGIMEALLRLHRATGDAKYLKPIPGAIQYLRGSLRADGRLARFYELKTNRPMYFERGPDGKHRMTYEDNHLAEGYGYIVDSKLDRIEKAYREAVNRTGRAPAEAPRRRSPTPDMVARSQRAIESMDARGAWVEKGRLRHHKVEPESGVIQSQTFARNVKVLCEVMNARQ